MKKILLLGLLVISLTTLIINQLVASDKYDCIRGNGNVSTSERALTGFQKVDVKGSFEVIIIKSNNFNVKIESDENLIENIKTEVKEGKLLISNTKSICGSKDLKITVYMPELNSISCSGASVVKSNDDFESEKFEIKSSGASEISAKINAKLLVSKFSGASSVKLRGKADTHAVESTGASSLKATELEVNNYAIDSRGASDCKINVIKELAVTSSGASDIKYIGDPKVSKSVKGASNISKL
jgi:hypothetical protein